MSDGYHPDKSKVSKDKLVAFIQAPLTGDLLEVPGIGPATIHILSENGITSTFGLIGKYLSFKDVASDGSAFVASVEHHDRFYFWLKSLNTPSGFRAGIVHSIGEKMNTFFVGIYEADVYGEA